MSTQCTCGGMFDNWHSKDCPVREEIEAKKMTPEKAVQVIDDFTVFLKDFTAPNVTRSEVARLVEEFRAKHFPGA